MDKRTLFNLAIEIADKDDRAAWIDRMCGGQPQLREELIELLRHHDPDGSFLEHPPVKYFESTRPTTSDDTDDERMSVGGLPITGDIDLHRFVATTLEPSSRPDRLGEIGVYSVIRIIGFGAMGVVLLAEDQTLHRRVALKLLAPGHLGNATARERFLREARAVANLSHANIVAIHAIHDQPLPFMVMEFVDGESVAERISRDGGLPVDTVLDISRQIALGLGAAHSAGIIHRDIKPSNVLVERNTNVVRITDFGLARAEDDGELTRTGEIAGTPQYMSPEQAQGLTIDHRSDLFSLGATMYAMCTGRSPFSGGHVVSILRRLCDELHVPARDSNPNVSPWLSEFIDKLLSKQPESRFQSAAEVEALLRQYQQHLDNPAATLAPHIGSASRAGKTRKPFRRLKWPAAISLGILIVIGAMTIGGGPLGNGHPGSNVSSVLPLGNVRRPEVRKRNEAIGQAEEIGETTRDSTRSAPIDRPLIEPIQLTDDAPPPAVFPFTADEAQAHQVAWSEYLGVPTVYTNSLGMRFRLIPPGEFMMGINDSELQVFREHYMKRHGEQGISCITSVHPAHPVRITKPFYIQIDEITYGDFKRITGRDFLEFVKQDKKSYDDPMAYACGWKDAIVACNALSNLEGYYPCYAYDRGHVKWEQESEGYRLPTEAEWEFACRAGTVESLFYGMTIDEAMRRYYEDQASVMAIHEQYTGRPTYTMQPNPFGILNMYGGGTEWCWDWFDEAYYASLSQKRPTLDPRGSTSGTFHVARGGGGAFDGAKNLLIVNSVARSHLYEAYWSGFGRMVLNVGSVRHLPVRRTSRPSK